MRQVGALQIGPGQGCHERVPRTGGIDHVGRDAGLAQGGSGAVGGVDPVPAQGDKHTVDPCIQKRLGGDGTGGRRG